MQLTFNIVTVLLLCYISWRVSIVVSCFMEVCSYIGNDLANDIAKDLKKIQEGEEE